MKGFDLTAPEGMQTKASTHLDLFQENRVRLAASAELAELRADIMRTSYLEGQFMLAPEMQRNYYFDKYLFETRPSILRRLGRFVGALVPAETDRLAAPALGAVAIGVAVSLELGLPLVIVALEPGADVAAIRGEMYPGERVTLIEDVVVTGSRALRAVAKIRDAGANVHQVVSVVDRQETAEEAFFKQSIGYAYLFTPTDLGVPKAVADEQTNG
jgi:orotate phosphoribosyltransferase